jgi:hypothetical protein
LAQAENPEKGLAISKRAYRAESQELLVRGDQGQVQNLGGSGEKPIRRILVKVQELRCKNDFMCQGGRLEAQDGSF